MSNKLDTFNDKVKCLKCKEYYDKPLCPRKLCGQCRWEWYIFVELSISHGLLLSWENFINE